MSSAGSHPPPLSLWALGGGAFALLAVGLELLGSLLGTAPTTAYPGWLVPVGWPTALRAGWWLLAAVGAGAAVAELTAPRSRTARMAGTALAVLPFAAFAVGVALGAPWATWH